MELLIKIEKNSSIERIANAIRKIKGVESVTSVTDNKKSEESNSMSKGLHSLMGCVSYTPEEIKADPKLSYLFSK